MSKANGLDAIRQERVRAEEALASIIAREREAEARLLDAGRPVLLGALGKVKIADMGRPDAKVIAEAIARHGGAKVAEALAALKSG